MNHSEGPSAFSRRGLVNAAAWSIPVVAVAAATPAAAASVVGKVDVRLGFGDDTEISLHTTPEDVRDAILDAVTDPLNDVPDEGPAALATLTDSLDNLVSDEDPFFNATFTYPATLNADNFGPGHLNAAEEMQVDLDFYPAEVDFTAAPVSGAQLDRTDNGLTLTYVTTAQVENGEPIFRQDLGFLPARTIDVSLDSMTQWSSTTSAFLLTPDADSSGNSVDSRSISGKAEPTSELANAIRPVGELIYLPQISVQFTA